MSVTIEERAYGPDSTPEEAQAIRDRIYPLKDDIIMYREMPVQSPYHLQLFGEKLREVAAGRATIRLLIDLTEAQPPNAETRAGLRELFGSIKNMRYVAVYTGKNFLLNIAAKFVLSGLMSTPFSVHKSKDEALSAMNDAVR
jgi:hypothetical protein